MASITQGNAFSTEELNKMKANYQKLQQPEIETPKIDTVVPTGVINAPVQTVAPTTPKTNTFVSNMSNISKADPNAISNSGYINALYQEKFRRDATQAELDKFTTNTVKDASNLILGQDMSPFRDVPNTDIGNTPTQIDPNAGADNLVDGLVKDDVVVDEEAQKIGYQAEIDKINAENQKALAEKQAIIDEKKAIEEARLEADRANLEAGIEKRDLTQDEINTDKELIEKENYFDSLSTINESISNAITDKAAFEAKMKAERGDNYRSIPSVKRVLDNYDEMIASSQILKNNLTTGFNNASIAVDNYYSSKMATIDSNEATYKTLYDLDNANVINLSKEEKANLDAQNAIAEEEKVKLQEKQNTLTSLLEDGNVYDRAVNEYGLNLDDAPEDMTRKASKAAQDQIIIDSLIENYPNAGIKMSSSLDDAYSLIPKDIQIFQRDDGVYEYNKSTGELNKILGADGMYGYTENDMYNVAGYVNGENSWDTVSVVDPTTGEIMNYGVYIPQDIGATTNQLAYRNNNPGNLRFAGQNGAVLGDNGFARFETPEAGYTALLNQISLDASRDLTLEEFINKYAPPVENDTNAYLEFVKSVTGASSNTLLKDINLNTVAQAIAKHESGTTLAAKSSAVTQEITASPTALAVIGGTLDIKDLPQEDRAAVAVEVQQYKDSHPDENVDDANIRLISIAKTLQDHKGLTSASGIYRFSNLVNWSSKRDFIAGVQQLVSSLTLDSLIKAKQNGATFGALSEGEMKVLASSATKIGTWVDKDKNGNVKGYNIGEQALKDELNNIWEILGGLEINTELTTEQQDLLKEAGVL